MEKLTEIYNKRFNAKMNKSTLSRYENGTQDPIYTVVVNLAKLFNVSVDFITCNEEISITKSNNEARSYTEQKILSNCQQLNEIGQKKVLDFSDDLVSTGKYNAPLVPEERYTLIAYGGDNEDSNPPIKENIT